MKPVLTHKWDIPLEEAISLQKKLSEKVLISDCFNNIELIAGTDVAYKKNSDELVAAVVIINAYTLELVEIQTINDFATFPYVSGLFSFREIPPLIKAFANLKSKPDLIVCDAQGIAHPRRFGLASHLGVIYDTPAIGCSKTCLIGEATPPDPARGSRSPLIDNGDLVGNVLRTQDNVNPVYVSVGHKISLASACDWILKLSPKYRLPETTRYADQIVNKILKKDSNI